MIKLQKAIGSQAVLDLTKQLVTTLVDNTRASYLKIAKSDASLKKLNLPTLRLYALIESTVTFNS